MEGRGMCTKEDSEKVPFTFPEWDSVSCGGGHGYSALPQRRRLPSPLVRALLNGALQKNTVLPRRVIK